VIAVQPNGSKPPLFCIHGYNSYRQLAHYLGPDQPFYGLGQHFSGKRVWHDRVEDRARAHVREIYAIQPRGPYYLAGHSFGGVIAFETAQQLQSDGHEVAFLGLVDTAFPGPRPNAWRRFCDGTIKQWHILARLDAAGRRRYLAYGLKAVVQWRFKAAQCYAYHLIGKSLPSDLLTFYIDEILFGRKYPKEQSRYQPRPYNGQVHYFKASYSSGHVTSWKAVVMRGLVVHEIPGTHLTMIEGAGARELACALKSCLEQAAVAGRRPETTPDLRDAHEPTAVLN
jgi:aspartate racemase